MKKNKFITLILVSAVCFSLILSLCSFTTAETSNSEDVKILSPLYSISLDYYYNNGSSYYYGTFQNVNVISVNSSNVPSTIASGFNIYGANNYDYTVNTLVGGVGYDINLGTTLATSQSGFTGVHFRDFALDYNSTTSSSSMYYYDTFSFVGSDDDTVNLSYSYLYFTYDGQCVVGNGNKSDIPITAFGGSNLNLFTLFGWVYNYIVEDDDFVTNNGYIYINDLTVEFSDVYSSANFRSFTYDEFDYYNNTSLTDFISYIQDLYLEQYDLGYDTGREEGYTSGYDEGYEGGYRLGYTDGYDEGNEVGFNQGVSQAPGIWGGLGEFLTTTIGSFLDFEIIPGLSITNMLTVLLAMVLVISFLRVYAGG